MRTSTIEDKNKEIDTFLTEKIEKLRNSNVKVGRDTIRTLISKFNDVKSAKQSDSDYFIKNYIKRSGLNWITLHGEAADVDETILEPARLEFREIIGIYEPKIVYNTDETSIYVKSTGNKSYVFDKLTDSANVKNDKTRVSIMLTYLI